MHESMVLAFIHELHHDPFLYSFHNHSSHKAANSKTVFVNPEQTPVQTHIYNTSYFNIILASKPGRIKYIDIVNDEIKIWLL